MYRFVGIEVGLRGEVLTYPSDSGDDPRSRVKDKYTVQE